VWDGHSCPSPLTLTLILTLILNFPARTQTRHGMPHPWPFHGWAAMPMESGDFAGAPFLAFFARSGDFRLSSGSAQPMFIRHRHHLASVRRVFLMPWGLKRYYGTGSLHFITWSCFRRKPLLGNPARRDLVLTVLELMRVRYRFAVIGYVVMPEHVHLLISEPLIGDPSKIIQAVKLASPGGWPLEANAPADSGRVVSMISICGANRKRPRS
jgi:hypothetical protein